MSKIFDVKDPCVIRYRITCRNFYQNFSTVLKKDVTHSPYQNNLHNFRKKCNAQFCLSKILEKWKSVVSKEISFGPLLKDHSEVLDYLSHDLLLAEWHNFGFSF